MFKSYGIDKGRIDKPTFFRVLANYFPSATAFYVRGSKAGIEKDDNFFE